MKITIIIPTYNSEKYICRCLDSIKCQSVKPYETIIVNDGSTDNTLSLLNDYLLENKKIITIENHGQGYARNLALSKAKGDYILFLDSDDILLENALEVLENVIKEENVDVVNFNYQIRNLDGVIKKHNGIKEKENIINGDCSILLSNKFYFTVNNLYKKEFLTSNNIKYGQGYIYEDFEFWVKVSLNARSVIFLKETLYEVIKEESSTTNTKHKSDKHAKDFLKATKVCLDYVDNDKRNNVKYLYKYILNRFFLYYYKRTENKYKKEFVHNFVNLISTYDIKDFGTKSFNKLVKYNVFKKRKYIIFKIYSFIYCLKKFKKRR